MDMNAVYSDTASAGIDNQHTDVNTEVQKCEIQNHTFSTTSYVLVPYQMEGYPRITKFTLVVLSSFITAYLCEHAFSERVDVIVKT